MRFAIVSGSAHPELAEAACALLGVAPVARTVECFPDGERRVAVTGAVRDRTVYVVQPLSPPADVHLVELLLLADGCRRAGAARVVAVIPYLAWARQDRTLTEGEPHSARLVADLVSSRADRALVVDVHSAAAEGFFSIPVDHLSAAPVLARALEADVRDAVVVAPDLGAVRRADLFGALLGAPVAYVHKTRVSPREVRAGIVAGDVSGRAPILVDDMISTGATIEAAVRALLESGCRPPVTVAATHGLLVEDALARLRRAGVARVVVTDSVPPRRPPADALEVVPLAPLLAEAIRRSEEGGRLAELRART
jgi:ribose-phosphate pyrophosphokinase